MSKFIFFSIDPVDSNDNAKRKEADRIINLQALATIHAGAHRATASIVKDAKATLFKAEALLKFTDGADLAALSAAEDARQVAEAGLVAAEANAVSALKISDTKAYELSVAVSGAATDDGITVALNYRAAGAVSALYLAIDNEADAEIANNLAIKEEIAALDVEASAYVKSKTAASDLLDAVAYDNLEYAALYLMNAISSSASTIATEASVGTAVLSVNAALAAAKVAYAKETTAVTDVEIEIAKKYVSDALEDLHIDFNSLVAAVLPFGITEVTDATTVAVDAVQGAEFTTLKTALAATEAATEDVTDTNTGKNLANDELTIAVAFEASANTNLEAIVSYLLDAVAKSPVATEAGVDTAVIYVNAALAASQVAYEKETTAVTEVEIETAKKEVSDALQDLHIAVISLSAAVINTDTNDIAVNTAAAAAAASVPDASDAADEFDDGISADTTAFVTAYEALNSAVRSLSTTIVNSGTVSTAAAAAVAAAEASHTTAKVAAAASATTRASAKVLKCKLVKDAAALHSDAATSAANAVTAAAADIVIDLQIEATSTAEVAEGNNDATAKNAAVNAANKLFDSVAITFANDAVARALNLAAAVYDPTALNLRSKASNLAATTVNHAAASYVIDFLNKVLQAAEAALAIASDKSADKIAVAAAESVANAAATAFSEAVAATATNDYFVEALKTARDNSHTSFMEADSRVETANKDSTDAGIKLADAQAAMDTAKGISTIATDALSAEKLKTNRDSDVVDALQEAADSAAESLFVAKTVVDTAGATKITADDELQNANVDKGKAERYKSNAIRAFMAVEEAAAGLNLEILHSHDMMIMVEHKFISNDDENEGIFNVVISDTSLFSHKVIFRELKGKKT